LMRLGGAFVAAVSAFPLSQYLERRDRMTNVRVLKAKWERVNSEPSDLRRTASGLIDQVPPHEGAVGAGENQTPEHDRP
jgi:hypothetical protein